MFSEFDPDAHSELKAAAVIHKLLVWGDEDGAFIELLWMDAWFWFPSAGVYFYFSKNRRALVSLGNLMCSRFSLRVGTAVFICGRTSSALHFCLCDAQSWSAVVSQSSPTKATLLHDRSYNRAFFCVSSICGTKSKPRVHESITESQIRSSWRETFKSFILCLSLLLLLLLLLLWASMCSDVSSDLIWVYGKRRRSAASRIQSSLLSWLSLFVSLTAVLQPVSSPTVSGPRQESESSTLIGRSEAGTAEVKAPGTLLEMKHFWLFG